MKHFNRIIILTLLTSLLAVSCHNEIPTGSRVPVVKVYDKYLYQDDIAALVPEGTTPQDSALKVRSYIDVWVRKQLMIKKAELYLTDEQKDVERQLEDYRASLLIYKYQEKYLSETFDTTVTPKEVETYYQQHHDDFKLQRNAVKAFFVKIPIESTDIQRLRYLLDFRSEKDSIVLMDLCHDNSLTYDNFGCDWISFAEASANMPENIDETDDRIKSRRTITQADDKFMYLLKIRDFLPAGSLEPFEMAQSRVSNVVLNSKMARRLNQLEEELYENAIGNGSIEYYDDKKINKQ
ncbi:MAG: hypothetical protein IKR94_03450 [Bacteroidales bacterium]|nr:hypothetical protein [Bacteroidales bacterium]MBR4214354.1 hypothetical protein [Bacteroidales bacterium]